MTYLRALSRKLTPVQNLMLGFVLLAVGSGFLLSLPIANRGGQATSFVDGVFMASSAVSTTGLGVFSMGDHYNWFGQLIMLVLIQVGGLGYMTFIALVIELFGQKLSLRGGSLMEESLAMPSRGEMRPFIRRVVKFTLLFEGLGATVLAIYWLSDYHWSTAVYMGIFHSISAFCTAGFSLFGDGFVAYRDDWFFNMVINIISIGGAIGFFVLHEASELLAKWGRRQRPLRISVHSRLALIMIAFLMLLGTAVLILIESQPHNQFLAASFQAITAASTTGFNTINLGNLNDTSLTVLMMLMFVGAPAGGTGGGIKATTFGVILLFLWAMLRGQNEVNLFDRRLSENTIRQSVSIGLIAFLWLSGVTAVLTATESLPFIDILFEAVSALGTVGLSTGITGELSVWGRWLIILSMLIGRIGPLGVAFSFVTTDPLYYRYPAEDVFVG